MFGIREEPRPALGFDDEAGDGGDIALTGTPWMYPVPASDGSGDESGDSEDVVLGSDDDADDGTGDDTDGDVIVTPTPPVVCDAVKAAGAGAVADGAGSATAAARAAAASLTPLPCLSSSTLDSGGSDAESLAPPLAPPPPSPQQQRPATATENSLDGCPAAAAAATQAQAQHLAAAARGGVVARSGSAGSAAGSAARVAAPMALPDGSLGCLPHGFRALGRGIRRDLPPTTRPCTSSHDVVRVPPLLVFHMDRLTKHPHTHAPLKDPTRILFPFRLCMDLGPGAAAPPPRTASGFQSPRSIGSAAAATVERPPVPATYRLVAVVEHVSGKRCGPKRPESDSYVCYAWRASKRPATGAGGACVDAYSELSNAATWSELSNAAPAVAAAAPPPVAQRPPRSLRPPHTREDAWSVAVPAEPRARSPPARAHRCNAAPSPSTYPPRTQSAPAAAAAAAAAAHGAPRRRTASRAVASAAAAACTAMTSRGLAALSRRRRSRRRPAAARRVPRSASTSTATSSGAA